MAEPTAKERKAFAKAGIAMPDGSYYIRDASDLQNAIDAVGRSTDAHDDVRKHIITRAEALKLTNKIPANWNSDGSLKHEDPVGAFLEHFGVKGMHWGVRRPRGEASTDHASATAILKKAHEGGGIHTLSNHELKTLNNRLNLETNHKRLTGSSQSGEQFVKELLKNEVKKEAGKVVGEYAKKGAEFAATYLAAQATKKLLGTRTGAGKHS
jgi:hypothetical protein